MSLSPQIPLLNQIEQTLWQCLGEGAGPGLSPFTMWQLATVDADGAPQVRTVVLRGVDAGARQVVFHTDARSEKITELEREPRVALVASDLSNFRQIRLSGRAQIHRGDEATRSAWSAARPHTLILYQTPYAPGTPVPTPEAAHAAAGVDPAEGYRNFAVVKVTLTCMEYLDISPNAHCRARFDCGEEEVVRCWVAP